MNKLEVLTKDYMHYIKNVGLYSYEEAYENDEDAFDNLYYILNKSTISTISNVLQDIEILSTKHNLSDRKIRKNFDNACNMILKLNEYELEKNKDIEL